ncbi:Lipopolysaccharide-modifying protein [Macrophomina phaseolina MS6]|uniref:Lipopolysaccharide-modifying protein n=1 Tax=Macrophomina phaseolina (strain MS6) TaxID=1126212 RepID=K2SA06_MACPH|nr:Lipopolysaccharide-modifying protein [Macrophomina phaseolina MS6]
MKWRFDPTKDSRNLGLSDEQCNVCIAFPKLYTELDRIRDHLGPNSLTRDRIRINRQTKPFPHGQFHILIFNGQIYIIDEFKGACDRARGLAGLSNLYRAITAMPDPTTIPDVEFIMDVEDAPTEDMPDDRIVWTWNRPIDNLNTWVIPNFYGWASPRSFIGSYVSFRERLPLVERPFKDKDRRIVWRGSMNNEVRFALINATTGKEWADVQETTAQNSMHVSELCKYQFLAHTEGNTWSGRLRYLVNCNSISVIHQPLKYQAHFYDMLVSQGPDQNYISVANDWSDLAEKMEFYSRNPSVAERIANNSVNTFRDRYMTPAAEACYWRRLIRNYADTLAFKPEVYAKSEDQNDSGVRKYRGVDWELVAVPDPNFRYSYTEEG